MSIPEVRRYVYANGRPDQYALVTPAKHRRGVRQEFVSRFLAERWIKDGKATLVTVKVP